ncbi:hypothetical protein Ancab_019446, partial [Ancistrocladus abbreviatus]
MSPTEVLWPIQQSSIGPLGQSHAGPHYWAPFDKKAHIWISPCSFRRLRRLKPSFRAALPPFLKLSFWA